MALNDMSRWCFLGTNCFTQDIWDYGQNDEQLDLSVILFHMKEKERKVNRLIKILRAVGPLYTNVILDYIQAKEGNSSNGLMPEINLFMASVQ